MIVKFMAFEPQETTDLVSNIIAVTCLLYLMTASSSRQQELMEQAWGESSKSIVEETIKAV
jgi:hypothetical protein